MGLVGHLLNQDPISIGWENDSLPYHLSSTFEPKVSCRLQVSGVVDLMDHFAFIRDL